MHPGKIKKGFLFIVTYVVIKWVIIAVAGGLLYRSGYWTNWYLLIFPVVGLTVFTIRSAISKKQRTRLASEENPNPSNRNLF